MKSVLIIAGLCLSLVLLSGITSAGPAPVFRAGVLATVASPATPAPAGSRKGLSGGQARWLRVVPGLFR